MKKGASAGLLENLREIMPFLKIQNNVLIPVASTHCSTQYL